MIIYTHGRFSPFHMGHFGLIKSLYEEYVKGSDNQLWIGISNPLRIQIDAEKVMNAVNNEGYNSLISSIREARDIINNLYAFSERYSMIHDSLKMEGFDMGYIKILPHFSFYDNDAWGDFMPPKENSLICLSPKDSHHYTKIKYYRNNGWNVKEYSQIPGVSGKIFDNNWPNGDWRELVPKGTRMFLENYIKNI